MSSERIVITGLGIISSIGINIDEFKNSLLKGISGFKPAENFNSEGFGTVVNAEVKEFDPEKYIHHTPVAELGRTSRFSIAAAKMAIEDAGFSIQDIEGKSIPVWIGTTDGESQSLDTLAMDWVNAGAMRFRPDLVEQSLASNLSNAVSRELKLCGESSTFVTACAAGNCAIGYAFDQLQTGRADLALCGGSEAVCRKAFVGFTRIGAMAPEKCQPFDIDRKGIIAGEGSGMLVLETLSSAKKRNARIYAEMLGYGTNCDANSMVALDVESVARCIRIAHENSGVTAQDVDYICAHGTGTQANDVAESIAINMVFGSSKPPVSSIKSMIGHSMGAATAMSSIACILAIQNQFVPPTMNHEITDDKCDIDCVPNKPRFADLRVVQSNGFGFGGNNAITIYGAFK